MKRIIVGVLGVVLVLTLLAGIGAGTFYAKFFIQLPEARYPAPETAAEARLQDLDYLRRLPEVDKSFSPPELEAFQAHIDEVGTEVETMSEAEFLLAVAAAAAISENGHTNASRFTTMNRLNSLPVRFFWFGDGLHIVRARAEQADLIGARVVTYDGRPPADYLAGIDPYHGGNAAFLRTNSAYHFAAPATLHAMGLIAAPDQVALELAGLDGTPMSRTLRAEAEPTRVFGVANYPLSRLHAREIDSGHDWRTLDSTVTEATWFGRHPERLFWSEPLEHGGVYWRLRNVIGNETEPLTAWLNAEADLLRASPARFLVLDLRSNGGGDYTRIMQVARNIGDLITPDGRVYILTDGGTFSAAVVMAAISLYGGGERAMLAGEPMGDDEQFWAEGGSALRLPNSDLPVYYSTGYHDWENGCSDWSRCFWINILFGVAAGPFEIDLAAPMLFSDYGQGIDSGMEAILAAETARASQIQP